MSDMSDSEKESPVNYRHRQSYRHPKLIDDDRNTKLHYAAASNDVKAVISYLEKESHIVDPQNYMGWTPLMMACRKGHFETVKVLLDYRANATKKNRFGMNVFQIAISSGNLEMVEFLLEHFLTGGISKRILEQNFSVASLAILFRHQNILEFLISKHFTIDEGTRLTGITPFMFAHALENDAAIATLLKQNVNTTAKNCIGHTAVDIATIRHQMKIIHTPDHKLLCQKLAAVAQESLHNEIQNQQLRQALQMKPDGNGPTPAPLPSPQICTPHMPVPYIMLTPYPGSPQVNIVPFTSQLMSHTRKSSNIGSPAFPLIPPPNVTPITPASCFTLGSPHQVFFPPDFSPSRSPYNIALQGQNSMSINVSDLLNTRFNSSSSMMLSSPVLNFLSPCM